MMRILQKIKKILPEVWFPKDITIDTAVFGTPETARFVVLDTETTGFDFEQDRMLCIGAIVLQNNTIQIQDSFEVYIHQEHYNQETAKIHGILKNNNYNRHTELEALQEFLKFVSNDIIVAHHTMFDITMINKALERNGLPILDNKTLDTGILYKKTLLKSHLLDRKDHYSLDDLAEKFDISKKDRHTALGDAFITAIAFLKIERKLKEKGAVTWKTLFGS